MNFHGCWWPLVVGSYSTWLTVQIPRTNSTFKFFFSTTTTTSAVTMDQYVAYNADYKVLICRQHKYAIPPDWVLRHFRESHTIPLATRQLIGDYSQTLELVMPENVATPATPAQCIEGLTLVNGFQCQYEGCIELRSTERSMKEHCRGKHEWKARIGATWRTQPFSNFFWWPTS